MAFESLFVSAFVYLLTAVICVPLAKRLGLSSVLGYLVAGFVIGPFVLGLVGEEGADVMHFAEFGVVLMLFLIGLELRPALLWRLRGPILGLGGAQVGITMVAIGAIGMSFGLGWQVALAVGMALALSSTAIVLQSLQEKNLTKSSGGQSAFSVLLFQDIAVIPMLAVFPMLATLAPAVSNDHRVEEVGPVQDWLAHQPGWMATLLVFAAVIFIILAGKYLFQPILNIVAKTRVRETFVALALLLVIGIALLMSMLGVSPALGTFLAGVVLADSQYRHELEADLEPFKGLLLGVFFISVGASIDFSLIAAKPNLVAALVVGLMVLKAAILFGLGTLTKLLLDQRMLFSLSLAQGGEFAFVLLGFGVAEGVVGGEVAQMLIASVALSMVLTPLVLILEEKVIRPRFGTRESDDREPDPMEEDAPVILAGFGRFGNFVGRLLRSQKIEMTVIDSDPDHVDFLRRIGIKAFYGDVNRHDLLEAAGAYKAKILIITLSNQEDTDSLIETAQKHFPHLKLMVRALERPHQYKTLEAGVDYCIHQHAGSATELGKAALVLLGVRAHRAERVTKAFRKHDLESVRLAAKKTHKDKKAYISHVRERLNDMERQFEEDQQDRQTPIDQAWDTQSVKNDILKK
ncbi:MAG: monovalent cation:proton antiporter-2 (CPA2) family protein [Verrucomicrobia bacterium]|nr:monovalent cation:proton antiporter-2 (CPA2) family protein [Verrucomicrobiota bacterium]